MWVKSAITPGEIDALRRAALAACNEDTQYPLWRGSSTLGNGECHNIARWLVERLGGHVGVAKGHYAWLSPDERFVLDLTGNHGRHHHIYDHNSGSYDRVDTVDNERTKRFIKRANRIFESLDYIIRLSLDFAGDAFPAEEPQKEDDSERFNDSWQDPEQYWHDEPSASSTPEGVYQFIYCNPAEAPIWMGDLSFRPIVDVQIGDEIVGWEFNEGIGVGRRRRLTRAVVTAVHCREASVVKVTMESGRTFRCTADHKWLNYKNSKDIPQIDGSRERFTEAKVGKTLVHVINPTSPLLSDFLAAASYLGGIFDGEGCASKATHPQISQCPITNPIIRDRILRSLDELGIKYTTDGAKGIYLVGGRQGLTNFANWANPVKRDGIAERVLGERWRNPDKVVAIEPDGDETVYGLTTTTGNYVAWGYASKNCNGQLEVSPNHSHEELSGHAGIDPAQHNGPFAAGHVVVTSGQATWEVQSNVNLNSFFRILKEATKNYGWKWGGMTNAEGQPVSEMFAPKKSATVLHYVFMGDHLYLGRTSAADLAAQADRGDGEGRAIAGSIEVIGDRGWVHMANVDVLPHLFEWASDNGLRLYSANDNVIKTIPTLQEWNNTDPEPKENWNPMEPSPEDERLPTGLYRCPACTQLFPNWNEYQKHRREQESWGDTDRSSPNSDYGLPEGDPGQFGDGAHFTEMRFSPGITTGKVAADAISCPNCGDTDTQPMPSDLPAAYRRDNTHQCRRCGTAFSVEVPPPEEFDRQHPDPWMDNEPGSLTIPPHWGRIAVLPARSWKEAARVDGFMKYAQIFNYDNDDWNFYVAYRSGDPIGYAAVGDDGNVHIIHSSVENQGAARAIFQKLTRHYKSLYTHSAHEKTVTLLKRTGWVQSKGQLWRWSADQAPTDMIEGSIPFIYDVQEDNVHVGHPGARTSDIPGRFTPGGIVEGNYEPGGKVVIRSMTSIPYTVRHLIELWYYTHPQLEVKSVHLQDDAGKDTRLASVDPGAQVKTLAAMDPAVQTATNTLQMAGGDVYAVGGAVRDAVMGKEPKDIDLMVTGLPAEKVSHILESLPGRVDFTGKDFGVFRYRYKGHDVEIALPRAEHSTGSGHKDFDVQSDHTMKPEDDFYRRDFTANAMGVNLRNGRLVDPFGGASDISSRTLRTLSDKSLAEDPLRVVRALVANARHGLHPDESTRAQMGAHAHGLQSLPAERIQAELDKLFSADDPARAVRLAHETGVLKYILPEVDEAMGYDQRNPHHELELGDHLLKVLERISKKTKDPDVRLAALLHDIGKPNSAWKDPETGSNHFYEHHLEDGKVLGADHEKVGADMARERMNQLRYPKDRINRVSELVGHHMYPNFSTTKGARRFLNRVGDHANDLHLIREADSGGKGGDPAFSNPALAVDRQRALVQKVRDAGEATNKTQLAIDGNDLISAGISPGPMMGQILNYLTERVVDDSTVNTKPTLLQLAKEYAKLENTNVQETGQEGGQAEEAQLSGVRGSEPQKLAQGNEEAEVTPEFPDSADAEAVHEQALQDHRQAPEALSNPGGLASAMGRAANYWHYGEGTPGERMADAAGALAHGVGMAQAFVDGNKRTAYHTTRGFLHANGYPHLSPVEHDDEELADHLIGHGMGTHSLEDTQQLFRSRLHPEERT